MSRLSKIFCGITLLSIPAIMYGGYFLLTVLSGQSNAELTEFQHSMFRSGHGHAGLLVILSLIAQILIEHATISKNLKLIIRNEPWGDRHFAIQDPNGIGIDIVKYSRQDNK